MLWTGYSQKSITDCFIYTRRNEEIRTFGTMTADIMKIAECIKEKESIFAGHETAALTVKETLNNLSE